MEFSHVRAMENQCYLISCDCAGSNYGNQFFGHSAIVDPFGVSIASSGVFGCIVKGEIDIEEVHRIRRDFPSLQARVLSV